MKYNNDVADFMRFVTREISFQYNMLQKRAKYDPGTAGDQGEENWKKVFNDWLPSTFHVVTKGRILFPVGPPSGQVDILVLSPSYPVRMLDYKYYLASGVIAAFECKTTLKKKDIEKSMQISAAIKKNSRLNGDTFYQQMNSSIIFGILAHSCVWAPQKAADTLTKHLEYFDNEFIKHPSEMPDLLCVADLASWSANKSFHQCVNTSYTCCCQEANGENFTPVGTLITDLLSKMSWQHLETRSIAEYFMSTNIPGSGQGESRIWEDSLLSGETIKYLQENSEKSNDQIWDEWSSSLI